MTYWCVFCLEWNIRELLNTQNDVDVTSKKVAHEYENITNLLWNSYIVG